MRRITAILANARARASRLRDDARGVALIEFAIVVPVVMLLYIGGWQLSDATACDRKVTMTTRAVADLASQYAILSADRVDVILGASAKVMTPYSNANAVVRVSEITTDQNGVTKVVWSRALGGTRLTPGSTFSLPAAIKLNGSSLIYADVTYNYATLGGTGLARQIPLSDRIYMVPRVSTDISCSNCNSN